MQLLGCALANSTFLINEILLATFLETKSPHYAGGGTSIELAIYDHISIGMNWTDEYCLIQVTEVFS